MSLASDWNKAAEKFKNSVSLQYNQFQKSAIQSFDVITGKQDVQIDFNQFVANVKKLYGSKTPLRSMVFELDIFNPPPPIVLLINPETFDLKCTPKISESKVRQTDPNDSGYIFQYHHDELDVVSASGRSAMFYSDKGLTAYDRINSAGYNNIQQLIAVYRNNGKNFSRKPGKYSLIESVGRVLLVYNEIIYKGSFENFSVTETDTSPFNFEFNFDYKVTQQVGTEMSNDILRNIQNQQQTGLVDII